LKPEGISVLKRSEMVANFGVVCPQALGDKMVREGVHFSSVYGMSEVGILLASSERTDDEWDWMLPVSWCEGHLDFRSIGESDSATHTKGDQVLYHLVILPSHKNIPSRFLNCNDPPGSFATGDLFLKHPQKPNRWKLVRRQDDQLKIYQRDRQSIVNALIYEDKIKRGNEDVLEEVVLFGQGRNKLGVLIFAQNAKGRARELVIARVWARIVHEINSVPRTGIDKNMIVVVSGDDEVPRTTKLNFIRPQLYLKYRDLIDAAYAGGEKTVQASVTDGVHCSWSNSLPDIGGL
jgi:hypothetical protein